MYYYHVPGIIYIIDYSDMERCSGESFGGETQNHTSHTMRVVPTPAKERSPIVVAKLATTIVIPVRAREYLDLQQKKIRHPASEHVGYNTGWSSG